MTETVIVDASVAIKWLVPERDWATARRLFERCSLVAPQLIFAECSNILWKKLRRSELTHTTMLQAAEHLVGLELRLEPLEDLMVPATELAAHLEHPAYDCFYLALAAIEDVRLVTSDDRLLRVLEQRGDTALRRLCCSLSDFEA